MERGFGDSTVPSVVVEEIEILERVRSHLGAAGSRSAGAGDYDSELVSLRDAIAEARPEDVPPLVEHMTRLQALAAQRGMGDEAPLDPSCPYFGHLGLEEGGERRDVLLGKRTYLAPEAGIRIVDWRNAPVSRMYYRYDEGDDYEEEFGGTVRRGDVVARRSVTVADGELVRVSSHEGVWVLRGGEWQRLGGSAARLSGGQGAAVRAERLSPVRGRLGVDADGADRRDRHLPEVSALLDSDQFDLIASPETGLLVIQGAAGSGKTTVGLHRAAYLAYQRRRRCNPRRMLVVVRGEALASYVSGVLPALGVHGVRVATFDAWASEQRRRHVRGLPNLYTEDAPAAVRRLKRHPAMLRVLDEIADRRDEAFTAHLLDAVSGTPDGDRVAAAWREMQRAPLASRGRRLERWLDGRIRIGRDRGEEIHPRTEIAAAGAVSRMGRICGDVASDWADLLTDRIALGEAMEVYATGDFSDAELDRVHRWCADLHCRMEDGSGEEPAALDPEDDAILLRLHQLEQGPLRGSKGPLELEHLMVDEAQDFCPLEVAVLLEAVGPSRPVTLAGDPSQRITEDTGVETWDDLLAEVGASEFRVERLEIAYRSTAQVMRAAREVLGPLAGPEPVARRRGAPVEWHRFSDPGQAVDFVGAALRDLARREPLASAAVIARYPEQARMYHEGLEKAEVARLRLVADQDFAFAPGVDVTDVRQTKGLEFDYVILVEVNAGSYPESDEARRLLHVGATRAAHQLWIVSTAEPSPLVPSGLLRGE